MTCTFFVHTLTRSSSVPVQASKQLYRTLCTVVGTTSYCTLLATLWLVVEGFLQIFVSEVRGYGEDLRL